MKLIYFHGFGSSGASGTVQLLRRLLPEDEIIAPDIPVEPLDALPYLREAMALVLKDYGELKNLYFYRNTLKLAVKLKGIKEVLHVTVNETVVDEDCSTLTFMNFSCTITAVEKGLELLASQRCPIGMESPKAASILKGARWTGLVRQ